MGKSPSIPGPQAPLLEDRGNSFYLIGLLCRLDYFTWYLVQSKCPVNAGGMLLLLLLLTFMKHSKDTEQKNESLGLEEERKYVCGLASFYLSPKKPFFFLTKNIFYPLYFRSNGLHFHSENKSSLSPDHHCISRCHTVP